MKAFYSGKAGDVLVLVFEDTKEARGHGANISAMQDGARFYAVGPDTASEADLCYAIRDAEIQDRTHGQGSLRLV